MRRCALFPPRLRWRAALLPLSVAAAVAVARAAAATTADDLCAQTDDPCVVSTVIAVDAGSVIDLGTRSLVIANHGSLNVGAGAMTVNAGDVTVSTGGSLQARGNSVTRGGTIMLNGATLTLNGSIDASGTPGGTLTLCSTGDLTMGSNVSITADGIASGSAGGNIGATAAVGNVSVAGTLSATGRNGPANDSGGDGGVIMIEGSAVAMALATSRVTVAAGTPDGGGGEIDLTSDSGGIETHGQLVASGPGVDGSGGAICIDAASTAVIAGTVDAHGASGGSIEITATTLAEVSGSLRSDGGTGPDDTGGTIDVSGCTILIDATGRLSSLQDTGTNTLSAGGGTTIAGVLRADPSAGDNFVRYSDPDHAPIITSGAQIVPPAELVANDVAPCGATNTPTPTPPPSGTCVGDCTSRSVVTISDLIIGVNIALDLLPVSACPAFDPDDTGVVTVSQLIQGVNNALFGCP